jgi:hypothetical protein
MFHSSWRIGRFWDDKYNPNQLFGPYKLNLLYPLQIFSQKK